MGLNYAHESTHSVYLKHVNNGTIADTFLGDNLFGADHTIPIQDTIYNTVKRIKKLSATTKATLREIGCCGSSTDPRGA